MPRLLLYLSVISSLWSASVLCRTVFSDPPKAHMLLRSRRANSFFEELKPGSLERECVEEVCDFEEAWEIFLSREATLEFWTVYSDGNQCSNNMCVHGDCVDLYQGYACNCRPGYEGKYCREPVTATNCTEDNGGCDHDCSESSDGLSRSCSCVSGYTLHDNSRKCVPDGQRSCGQLLIGRSSYTKPMDGLLPWMVAGEVGKKGENPWQVLIRNANRRLHCGGVLIDESWVLTAAHCLESSLIFTVRLGEYDRLRDEGTEVTLRVLRSFRHPKYDSRTQDNDIALMRLETPAPFSRYILPVCLPGRAMAERVLHLNSTITVVSGWGKEELNSSRFTSALNIIKIPLVDHDVCIQHMTNNITNNMLCAGRLGDRQDACEGDSGGPMVTLYRDTWFLVGLVSWGEGCGQRDKLGIYTKVSNYNDWIQQVKDDWDRGHYA